MAAFDEVAQIPAHLKAEEVTALGRAFEDPKRRWFFTGQGRSGLVAAMVAMRFMHLGRVAHVLGEPTAPAVRSGDGLLVICGSGQTPISVSRAARAHSLGALVAAVTHSPVSPLGEASELLVTIASDGSGQLGGSLFEQSALLLLDGMIHALAANLPDARDRLRRHHANLE